MKISENENYFEELKLQILDKNRWDKYRFKVFTYEAGSGKSGTTQELLAQVSQRALYVQKFAKDNLLEETTNRINLLAGKEVAVSFAGEDTKIKKARKRAIEARILCITHKMYINICKGHHSDLMVDREILIIDEYPDLLEPISLTSNDIGMLFTEMYKYNRMQTDELAIELRKIYHHSLHKLVQEQMIFIEFNDSKYDKYKKVVNQLIKETRALRKTKHTELLFKIKQILKNGCYFSEQAFHTFNSDIHFALLKCNIILDANKEDYRYSFSNIFDKVKTPQQFSFAHANFYHYDINTSKKALKSYLNLTERALEHIGLEKSKGALFVTDKEGEEKVRKGIETYYNDSLDSIQQKLGCAIKIDHFGNLIGRNDFREFDTVAILKSPYFDYRIYALTSFLYKHHAGLPIESISLFKDKVVEKIRLSTVAGEIYQAIRRVARDNPGEAKVHVFNDNQEVVNLVLNQLTDIQLEKRQLEVNKMSEEKVKEESGKRQNKFAEKVEEVKEILLKYQREGVKEVRKKDIRLKIGICDSANFSKVMAELQLFLKTNKIENQGTQVLQLNPKKDVS